MISNIFLRRGQIGRTPSEIMPCLSILKGTLTNIACFRNFCLTIAEFPAKNTVQWIDVWLTSPSWNKIGWLTFCKNKQLFSIRLQIFEVGFRVVWKFKYLQLISKSFDDLLLGSGHTNHFPMSSKEKGALKSWL